MLLQAVPIVAPDVRVTELPVTLPVPVMLPLAFKDTVELVPPTPTVPTLIAPAELVKLIVLDVRAALVKLIP